MPPHPRDLRILRTSADGFELDRLLATLLSKSEITKEVEQIVEHRVDHGYIPRSDVLSNLIIETENQYFYNIIENRLKSYSNDGLLALHNARFPDPKIEEILAARLYACALEVGGYRTGIVKSLSSAGSLACLPTLESIERELHDQAYAAKQFGPLLPWVEARVAAANAEFYEMIVEAINSVRSRAEPPLSPRPKAHSANDKNLPPKINTVSELIRLGETDTVEFKSTLRTNRRTGEKDSRMEGAVLKALAGFLNAGGGKLLVGVEDDGTPVGIQADLFESEDRMSLHLINLLRDRVGGQHAISVHPRFGHYKGERILVIECDRSNVPVFVSDGHSKRFFVRHGPSTQELQGFSLLDYIKQRFPQT